MEQLVNFIIRPPRADYSPRNDLLDEEFMLKGRWYRRNDLEVINSRGNVLKCSHYVPLVLPVEKILPCVIYCHGNSGCRADASEAAIILLPSNITVFTLDFSGSGLSEGEHVTLGWNEKDDLRAVVNHLRTDGNVSCIGLWGRSMGAVTSLMYGAEDPSIAGMVLDSPFSNLVDLMMELVDTYKYPLPKFTVKLAIQHMRKVIRRKANFDIMELDTIQVAKCCFVPVLLGHATDDDFIRPHHSDRIYATYVGDKNIIKFDGDHNSPRPQFYFDSITIFFHNVLDPPKDVSDEQYFHTVHDIFDGDRWDTVHGIEYRHHSFFGTRSETTEDAINQLRSKRPMSRMEVPSDIPPQRRMDGPEEDLTVGPSSRTSSAALPNGQSRNEGDNEFLEYTFDSLSDVPSCMEDEERMIMEAIIESLKDLKTGHQLEDQSSVDESASNGPSSNPMPSMPHRDEPSQETIITDRKLETSTAITCEAVGSGTSTSFSGIKGPSSNSSSCDSGRSSTCECRSVPKDVDTADDGTKATLVIQKSPSGHIMDGLAHRWGLNFFKSNRQ